MVQFHDLVAGMGGAGYAEGPFHSALFHHPCGLALNADGSILYVSDRENHRLRAVALERLNEVSTAAGTGRSGRQDGPAAAASFRQPEALALLPDGRIAVSDSGNNLLRVYDPVRRTVTTLAGSGQDGMEDGPAARAPLGGVYNMAFVPKERALYFTQPRHGLLRRLLLDNGAVETVLKSSTESPNPAALALHGGKLHLADQGTGRVFEVALPAGPGKQASLKAVASGKNVVALASSGGTLYALQADPASPWVRLLPQPGRVNVISLWGDDLGRYWEQFPPTAGLNASIPPGFLPDPRSERRFYAGNPSVGNVTSLRDLHFLPEHSAETMNHGMVEYDYPVKKPPRTFRILLCGRSYVYGTFPEDLKKRGHTACNVMGVISKKLEITLNTMAALNDETVHYEVLNQGMIYWSGMLFWAPHLVPPVAEKMDADLVLLMMDPLWRISDWFDTPLDRDGIPADRQDAEYMLKPWKERVPGGIAAQFLAAARRKGLARTEGEDKLFISPPEQLIADPDVRPHVSLLAAKPLRVLNERLGRTRTASGVRPRLAICLMPIGVRYFMADQQAFWRELTKREGIAFTDLTPAFTALRPTFFPLSESRDTDHFSADGFTFVALMTADRLVKDGLIPMGKTNTR
jgi:DNA-binding beta-propeller fold protein YncE